MLRDTIPNFELYQPDTLETALDLLNRFGSDGWRLAGGYDSMDWFKDRTKQPKAVIDLTAISELQGVHETADGVEIGAMTTLTEVERSPVIRKKFGLLAAAARSVASPQIRNAGGNVCQELGAGTIGTAWTVTARAVMSVTRTRAGRAKPRALSVRRRSLRRRDAFEHGARHSLHWMPLWSSVAARENGS